MTNAGKFAPVFKPIPEVHINKLRLVVTQIHVPFKHPDLPLDCSSDQCLVARRPGEMENKILRVGRRLVWILSPRAFGRVEALAHGMQREVLYHSDGR